MKVILTGATGMIGKGVLYECLDSDVVEHVLVVGRNSVEMNHPKLKELVIKDMYDLTEISAQLKGYDACFFCLGISAFRMSEADYTRITYDLTLNFAQMVLAQSPQATFIYVSGEGTDSTEKSLSMWARVKGKTENDLLKLGFGQAYMFRPGAIYPERGIRSRTPIYNTFLPVLKMLYPALKTFFPNKITTTSNIGKAMIRLAQQQYKKQHIISEDINRLAVLAD
ncbi:MAG: NAD-dependent epimerase/dehydratase family protein [Flammeovirgaceae bacterium]